MYVKGTLCRAFLCDAAGRTPRRAAPTTARGRTRRPRCPRRSISPRRRRHEPRPVHDTLRLAVVVVLLAVLLAGCGGGSTSSSGSSSAKPTTTSLPPVAKPPPNAEEGTVFVSLGSVAGLGQVLVDSEGHTLYAFSADGPAASSCEAACEKAWPPLLVEQGEPYPSNGTSAARLSTLERADGARQVTYAGRPLYTFGGDKSPGEANGAGSTAFGGTWTPLRLRRPGRVDVGLRDRAVIREAVAWGGERFGPRRAGTGEGSGPGGRGRVRVQALRPGTGEGSGPCGRGRSAPGVSEAARAGCGRLRDARDGELSGRVRHRDGRSVAEIHGSPGT